jgi:phosphopantothenate synthetase
VPNDRCRFLSHKGKQIYLIDIEGLTPEQVMTHIPIAAKDIRAQPPSSVMTLVHVKGVKLEERMNNQLKDLAAGNKPYVKLSAISGLSPLQRVVLNTVKIFTRREFHLFDEKEKALDFLAAS